MAIGYANQVTYNAGGQQSATWPIRIGVIPTAADRFQHRSVINDLDIAIAHGDTVVLCQVLAGAGGVGKTQLAAHYARRQLTARSVDILIWVTASTRDGILSAYAHAGSQLTGVSGGDLEQAAHAFLVWLETIDRRWLIVLDDLVEPAAMNGLWPPEHPTGRVVVTTRRQDAALTGASRRMVFVGLFTPDEATSYITTKFADCDIHEDLTQIMGLAEDLGFLPLALAQAVSYIIDRRLSCAEYRRRLHDRRRMLAEILPESSALPDGQRATVAATWSLSIELANGLNPVGLARPTLELASMLDANGIPIEILTSPSALGYITSRRTADPANPGLRQAVEQIGKEAVEEALLCLHRLSLANISERSARIHGLIQRATRDELVQSSDDDFDHAIEVAAKAIIQAWPLLEREAGASILRANADALHSNVGPRLWSTGAHLVLFRAGLSLDKPGQYTSAALYWEQLRIAAERHLGPDHGDALAARAQLARAQAQAGARAAAIAAATELIADQTRVLGSSHLDTLKTRGDVADWLGKSGDLAGAARATEDLLNDQIRTLGAEHPDTWETHRKLIHWEIALKESDRVAEELGKLLDAQIRVLGAEDRKVLRTRRRLAYWWGEIGNRKKALAELEMLLADQRRILGPDDEDTRKTLRNIAQFERMRSRSNVTILPAGDEDIPAAPETSITSRLYSPDLVLAATVRIVAELEHPVSLAAIAGRLLGIFGRGLAADWAGYYSFKALLLSAVPAVNIIDIVPGYVIPEGANPGPQWPAPLLDYWTRRHGAS